MLTGRMQERLQRNLASLATICSPGTCNKPMRHPHGGGRSGRPRDRDFWVPGGKHKALGAVAYSGGERGGRPSPAATHWHPEMPAGPVSPPHGPGGLSQSQLRRARDVWRPGGVELPRPSLQDGSSSVLGTNGTCLVKLQRREVTPPTITNDHKRKTSETRRTQHKNSGVQFP
ncbi:Hypothetical predicted protein [Pelobates cultripes]|uniref:Uncharacterized protein n=1 Tax=Pelobates cultripes TaxID=61616 RepID=A0AAD1VPE3_PELCU|nr:Hypothetical predicted protein [Pelobates cultripes]